MRAQGAAFLEKANELLGQAETMLGVDLKTQPGEQPASPGFTPPSRSFSMRTAAKAARSALQMARRFVACVAGLLSTRS